jgi:maltose O-acetyltransferase
MNSPPLSEMNTSTSMPARSEKQKMLAGELYDGFDADLLRERHQARRILSLYNSSSVDDAERRADLLSQLFGRKTNDVWIETPFLCDYGRNIYLGQDVFINANCVILDCHEIHVGDGTLLAPGVQIYAAYHPTDPELRKTGRELAAPVRIGRNVWIGGGAIICPGVTIGDDTTIGAGSVVVKDIPSNVVAAGNPCRVRRELDLSGGGK